MGGEVTEELFFRVLSFVPLEGSLDAEGFFKKEMLLLFCDFFVGGPGIKPGFLICFLLRFLGCHPVKTHEGFFDLLWVQPPFQGGKFVVHN